MTREEKKLRRRQNLLMALCIFIIIVVWVAALLLNCNVYAASESVEAVSESDTLTTVLAIIGSCWVSWKLVCCIEWLDTPRTNKKGEKACANTTLPVHRLSLIRAKHT